jgi:glycosyltransferase involved in cell wall biosynthesis
MKILLVCPYFSPKIGGLENYALTLAEGLFKNGHQIIVVTTDQSSKKRYDTDLNGLHIIYLPATLKISNTPFNPVWFFNLRQIIRQYKPDLINAHLPVPGIADMAFLARGKTPFVPTYHAGSMKKGSSLVDTALGIYERVFLKQLLRRSNKIICVYPRFIQTLLGEKATLTFLPPGVDVSVFKPAAQRNITKQTILFVGRIDHTTDWKGLRTLLGAFKIVLISRPKAQLQIVGSGDAVAFYQDIVRQLDITKNVVFSGILRGKELAAAYRNAATLVLPSESDAESFGIVLIEAMACGLPVIGSRIGGIPNVIRDNENGLLVQPRNPEDLAAAITHLLSSPELAMRFRRAGLDDVQSHYTAQRLVSDTENLFQNLCRPSIIHVVANYPPHLGGMEKVVQSLSNVQADDGTRTSVITSDQGAKRTDINDRIPVQRLKSIVVANTPIMPTLLPKLLRVRQNEIVHLHVAQAYVPEMVWLGSKLRGYSYIAHVHLDIAPSGRLGFLLNSYKKVILKRVLRSSAAVIVFDEDQKRALAEKYSVSLSRIDVVPNGVEQQFFSEPHDLHLKPRLLFVGRLSPQKNLEQLLQALKGISGRIETHIVGDGNLSTQFKKTASHLKLKNLTFHGRLDGDDLVAQYKRSDFFVLPSEREGMPLVLLEAMAAALPIVGTDVPGIRNLVDDQNGCLVPLHDDRAMAAAILDLTSDEKRYARKSRRAHVVAQRYTWEHVVADCNGIYTRVRS